LKLHAVAFATLLVMSIASAERVRVGMYQAPPLLFRDSSGVPSGLYPNLLQEIAVREGWQLEWVDASWPELRTMLGSGDLDLLPAIAYTEERDSLYDFNAETVLSNWAVIFGRPGTEMESIIDLDGSRVAVLEGDVYYNGFQDLAHSFGMDCDYAEYSTYDSVMLALDRGAVEAALVPRLYASREEGRFDVSRTPILCCPIELRFAVPPDENPHLLAALDKNLREFREDPGSVYHESLDRWLGREGPRPHSPWLWWALAGLAAAAAVSLTFVVLTRRKVRSATEKLRESNAQMQAILDGSPDLILLLDTDRKVLWANQSALDKAPDAVGRTCFRAFVGTDSPCPDCTLEKALETGSIERGIDYHETTVDSAEESWWDNTAVPVRDGEGRIESLVAISRNITEQMRTEQRIRQSEQKYRSVVEGSRDGIVIHREGTIIYANASSYDETGYSPEEILGRNILEFIVPEQRALVVERMMRRGNSEDVPATYEITLTKRDGGRLPVEMSASIIDYEGEPAYMVFLRDITERLALEQQLRQAQKMEAVGQLAGGVAHDFNNLLQVITGYTEMAMGMVPAQSPALEKLREVSAAGGRAASLVRQLLAFSRNRNMRLKTISVERMIRGHLEMLERIIGEDIELAFSCEDGLPPIRGDAGMLEQVMINLFLNARDAMPDGGSIEVSARETVLDGDFCSRYPGLDPGRFVAVRVEDTGMGMDSDTLERIFEPFFTTKEQGSGTGLGLSTVYGIVKQHGGVIMATSKPGDGSIFTILLPAADGEPATNGSDRGGAPVRGGTERILVAEDSEKVRSLLSEILSEAGYSVRACSNGLEAISAFRETDERPDLVILDIIMPEMGGEEAAERILEIEPAARILFCSGYGRHSLSLELDGRFSFIKKPYTRLDILAAVRSLLD
jgi:PAS domain S-box-containing protein